MERTEVERAAVGTRVGDRYELVRPLARGGMGQVWVGRHLALDRLVAIKLVESRESGQDAQLLSEARMLAKLRHPHVVEVFDCGTDASGTPFIAMELLEGPTLSAYLESNGALGAARATTLLLPILDGLSAVHAAGLVHHDLKPENVVLLPSSAGPVPKLIDFGIARAKRGSLPLGPGQDSFVGTPQYMAPEQIHGARGDLRSDLWAATALLYEALSGRPAFVGEDLAGVLHAIVHDPPAFPAHVPDVDGKLWSILMLGLRKRPDERYASCDELSSALEAWLAKPGREASALPPVTRVLPALHATSSPDAVTLTAGKPRLAVVEGPLDELMRAKGPRS